jgi:hypothetical protein
MHKGLTPSRVVIMPIDSLTNRVDHHRFAPAHSVEHQAFKILAYHQTRVDTADSKG